MRGDVCLVSGAGEPFVVTGQTARTVRALVAAGATGLTSLEAATWAYRLAAYVWKLRRHGLAIDMLPEPHDGGWHARYVLRSAVTLDVTT